MDWKKITIIGVVALVMIMSYGCGRSPADSPGLNKRPGLSIDSHKDGGERRGLFTKENGKEEGDEPGEGEEGEEDGGEE
jgi:hypothetical protein